ncbi:MAG: 4Fe-4S binding protein [Candidatus Hodarchaeales archaeon]|jgi:pyruvate ferredoxin oxidoreductase delta subunit
MKYLTPEEMEDFTTGKWGVSKIPPGGVIPFAHSARFFKTGDWRGNRGYPVHSPEKCISCLRCYFYCPDDAIRMVEKERPKDGKMVKMPVFNLDYCKGCGVCSYECPRQAIEMKQEEIV